MFAMALCGMEACKEGWARWASSVKTKSLSSKAICTCCERGPIIQVPTDATVAVLSGIFVRALFKDSTVSTVV